MKESGIGYARTLGNFREEEVPRAKPAGTNGLPAPSGRMAKYVLLENTRRDAKCRTNANRGRNRNMLDYLIVGAGLAGAVFASVMTEKGCHCMVLEKRDHIGGNIYSSEAEGIEVHQYGPHIFHTDREKVWEFVNRFTPFSHFVYSPVAKLPRKII